MKTPLKSLLAGAALLALSGTANATFVPTVWTDAVSFPNVKIDAANSFSYTHDITREGFVAGKDTVDSYSLSLNLFDDSKNHGPEIAYIDLPGLAGDRVYFNLSGTEYGGWSALAQAVLGQTGQLQYSVFALVGEFFLGGSTLTVHGERSAADPKSVPEPGVLGLFGLGLLGAAVANRQVRRARN